MTSSSASKKAQAQSASIPLASPPLDDSNHLHFDTLHDGFHANPFSRLSHHPNTHDGALSHPWSSTQSEAESNLGRVHQFNPSGDRHSLSTTFFPNHFSSPRVIHPYFEHATQILHWVCHAPYSGPRIQSLQKVFPTHQRSAGPSRTRSLLLERARQLVHLGFHPNLHRTC